MNVELTSEALRWIEDEVAHGVFPTVQASVRRAVDHLRVERLRAKPGGAVAEGGSSRGE